MIKKIYINNYKALVNFSLDMDNFQLWLGKNGTGKSSVFEVLEKIKRIISGEQVHKFFTPSMRTKWMKTDKQEFSLKIELGKDIYKYTLILGVDNKNGWSYIAKESLLWNNRLFYSFEEGEACLYRLNWMTHKPEIDARFHTDWHISVMANLIERDDNKPLFEFRNFIGRLMTLFPIPIRMNQVSANETSILETDISNFVSWYRFILQENSKIYIDLSKYLGDSMDNFERMNLKSIGDGRSLEIVLSTDGDEFHYAVNELSIGQHQLIVLYAIAAAIKNNLFSVLVLDEPENFLSLPEIRPFIAELEELSKKPGRQISIISHHPEVINEMGHGNAVWFSREKGSHVIMTKNPKTIESLAPAEIFARGWENA